MKDLSKNPFVLINVLLIAASFCAALSFAPGCGAGASGGGAGRITIAGSTSVQPILEKLAERYMAERPGVKIEVQGGGSSAGIQAARSGAADAGASSRELKPDEKDLYETVICRDAIVLIVNPASPVKNLSRQEIRNIFSKGADRATTVITREEGSGTRGAFEELIMGKTEIAPSCLVQDSTGALREIVASDPKAIGYVSFGGLNESVRAVAVDGIVPEMSAMTAKDASKRYSIIRPFLLATRKAPAGKLREFVDFIRSAPGVALLKKEGLVPADE